MHDITNQYSATLVVLTCVLVGTGAWEARGETTSYHIGNSLTVDSEPLSLTGFASLRGLEHRAGYHIRSSWPLNEFLQQPDEVSLAPIAEFGKYSTALVNHHWDAVTLQPHPNALFPSTLSTDINSILTFIDLTRSNPTNESTNFYIYQGWPRNGSYQSDWTAPLPNLNDPTTEKTRDYYGLLLERVRAETNANVFTIPVGEVLFELDVRMKAGKVPGFFAVNDLYRDASHLTIELGRYVAAATTFATLFDETPLGLTKPAGFFLDQSFPLSPELYESVNKAIRDVLNADPGTGVYFPLADFDGNEIVDSVDLSLWEKAYGGSRYDLNGDEQVSGADFLVWQSSFDTELPGIDESPANLDRQGLVDSDDLRIWEQSYAIDDGGDLDGDGDTDGFDFLDLQREFTPYAVADKNRDRLVDGQDLKIWEEAFGYDGVADADEDGFTTGADFLKWQSEFSRLSAVATVSAESIPEPAGFALSVLAGLLLADSLFQRNQRRSVAHNRLTGRSGGRAELVHRGPRPHKSVGDSPVAGGPEEEPQSAKHAGCRGELPCITSSTARCERRPQLDFGDEALKIGRRLGEIAQEITTQ